MFNSLMIPLGSWNGSQTNAKVAIVTTALLPPGFAFPTPQACLGSGLRSGPINSLYWAYTETHLFYPVFFCPCLPSFIKFLTSKLSWDLKPGWEVVFSRTWAFSLLRDPHEVKPWHVLPWAGVHTPSFQWCSFTVQATKALGPVLV